MLPPVNQPIAILQMSLWPDWIITYVVSILKLWKPPSCSSIELPYVLGRRKTWMFATVRKIKAINLPLASHRWGNYKSPYPWDHTGHLFAFTPQGSRKPLSIDRQKPRPWQCSLQQTPVRWKHQKEWVSFPTSCRNSVLVHKSGMKIIDFGNPILLEDVMPSSKGC